MPWVAVPAAGDCAVNDAPVGAAHAKTVRVSYSLTGRGSVLVVLLPGMCVPRVMYDVLAERLASDGRYTAVSIDNRGMGDSEIDSAGWSAARLAADAWAVVDDVRTCVVYRTQPRVALVGHSMGGMIVQRMAMQRPREVGLLALLSTHAGGFWNLLPTRAMVVAFAKLVWHRFTPSVRAGVSIGLHFTDRFLDSAARRRAEFMRRYMEGAENDFGDCRARGKEEDIADAAMRGHLSVVRGHSLLSREAARLATCEKVYKVVLAGRSDCVVLPSASRRLANAIQANVVVEVDGAHFVVEEAEDAVIANVVLGLNVAFGGGGDGEGRVAHECQCNVCLPQVKKHSSCFEDFRLC